MAIFCLKKLDRPTRVGEVLKKKRQEQKLSLEEASSTTRIPKKYLQAMEKGDFAHLPQTKAHCVAYLKKYAALLNMDSNDHLTQFITEANWGKNRASHPLHHLKIKPLNSIIWWFKRIATTVLIFSFVGYLTWQINGILRPPKLTVFIPFEGYITNRLNTLVQGKTDKEVKLTINGKEVVANDYGQFEITLDLPKGVNTITIAATKKHGKTTTVTRHVIVKDSQGYQTK